MGNVNVELDWLREELFVGRDRQGTTLTLGRDSGSEPEWRGMKASDLLLLSLIACSAHDVVTILHKQKQVITTLRIEANGEQDDDPPWRFRKIRVCYKLAGHNLAASTIKRAIE